MRILIDRTGLVAAVVAGLVALLTTFSPAVAAEKPLRSPEVTHTGKGPTGYTVTFRYANPTAKKVLIKGEWSFARPSELPQIAATPDHPIVEGQGLLPKDWQQGDFPLQRPNSTGPNFPVADMTKGKGGIWTYTIPLPSGTFTYAFFVDCSPPAPGTKPAPGQPQCRPISDPNNRPWNEKDGVAKGSVAPNSQVYVPSDALPGRLRSIDNAKFDIYQGICRGGLGDESLTLPGKPPPMAARLEKALPFRRGKWIGIHSIRNDETGTDMAKSNSRFSRRRRDGK